MKAEIARNTRVTWNYVIGYRLATLAFTLVPLAAQEHLPISRGRWALLTAFGFALTLLLLLGRDFWSAAYARYKWVAAVDSLVIFAIFHLSGTWSSYFFLFSLSSVITFALLHDSGNGIAIGAAAAAAYLISLTLNGLDLFELLRDGRPQLLTTTASYVLVAVFFSYPASFLRRVQAKNKELEKIKLAMSVVNKELNSVNKQLLASQSINTVLQSLLDLPRVVETVADGIKYGLDFDRAVVGLVDEGENTVSKWYVAGAQPDERSAWQILEISLAPPGPMSKIFADSRPVLLSSADKHADPALCACLGSTSFVVMPLTVRNRAIGLIIADNPITCRPIAGEDLDWLQVLGTQAAVALNNAQLYAKAHELAAVRERNRIAMEIHDGLSQTISGARLILNSCKKLLATEPERVGYKLAYLEKMLARSYAETRYAIFNLRSPFLVFDSVSEFFRQSVTEFGKYSGIATTFFAHGSEELASLPEDVKFCLSRVLQESLSNVHRHADAKALTVRCRFTARGVAMLIEDNGRGFDLAEARSDAQAGRTFGLITTKERVSMLGGSLEVDSEIGRGTVVKVSIPCARAPQERTLDQSTYR